MKKYTPVFGPQELFDGAPDDVDMIGHSGGHYKNTPNGILYCGGCTFTADELRNTGFIAMRRIIKTPVWTVADQKAGRLPEVGAHLLMSGDLVEFIGLSNQKHNWCFRRLEGNFGIQTANKEFFAPIETPAEKAARLKSEWCAKAAKQLKNLEYTSTLTSIYDALLSGELKAPESTE